MFWLQFQVVATDKGRTPLLSLPASVSIDVIKNQNPPVFVNKPYNRTVNENTPVGNTIIRISAVDVDTRVRIPLLFEEKLSCFPCEALSSLDFQFLWSM